MGSDRKSFTRGSEKKAHKMKWFRHPLNQNTFFEYKLAYEPQAVPTRFSLGKVSVYRPIQVAGIVAKGIGTQQKRHMRAPCLRSVD